MKNDPPFFSPQALIEAVAKDLRDLQPLCEEYFLKTREFRSVEELDPNTGENVIKIQFRGGIPTEIRVSVSRMINDLRHALDQATCDGAIMLGAPNAKDIYFPFGSDQLDFERNVKEKCRKVHPELRDFISQFRSYKGGNDFLWSLTRLAAKKHQSILALSTKPMSMNILADGLLVKPPCRPFINKWDDERNELEFARVGRGGYFQMQVKLDFEIVFANVEIVEREPILGCLSKFIDEVQNIVRLIKAQAERIACA